VLQAAQHARMEEAATRTPMHIVDLRATYDTHLIQRFYDEIIMANFPIEDERDDLEWFQNGLLPAAPEYLDPKDPLLFVLIAMAPHPTRTDEIYKVSEWVIFMNPWVAGGMGTITRRTSLTNRSLACAGRHSQRICRRSHTAHRRRDCL
jgi:hypothetical protein